MTGVVVAQVLERIARQRGKIAPAFTSFLLFSPMFQPITTKCPRGEEYPLCCFSKCKGLAQAGSLVL